MRGGWALWEYGASLLIFGGGISLIGLLRTDPKNRNAWLALVALAALLVVWVTSGI